MFTPYHAGDRAEWQAFLDFCGVWLLDSGDPGYDDAFDVVDDNVIDIKDFAVFAASWDLPSSEESDWYYLHDALGSVVGVVGARFGRESDREFYLYDVYGQPDVLPANGNPYLFTGRRYDWVDDDLVLYYLRARHYSPLTGRFLQTDPIEQLPVWLRPLSHALPLTYGADVLDGSIHRSPHLPLLLDFGLLLAFCAVLFGMSLRNIRRKWIT